MAEEIKVDDTVDITDVVCPVTFVKAKVALEELEEGQVLFIRMNEGEPVQNVPRSIKDEGHQILKLLNNQDGTYSLIVRKAGEELDFFLHFRKYLIYNTICWFFVIIQHFQKTDESGRRACLPDGFRSFLRG